MSLWLEASVFEWDVILRAAIVEVSLREKRNIFDVRCILTL